MPTRTLDLRGGNARDAALVEALMGAAFDPRYGEAWTRNQCLGVLAMPGVRLTLAMADDGADGGADARGGEADGGAVGFTLVRTVMDEAELLLLAVAPAARRRGVGGALLRAAIAEAEMAGVTRLHLEVRANNDAVQLYRRHGFTQQGVRPNYYRGRGGEHYDAHTYARSIGG